MKNENCLMFDFKTLSYFFFWAGGLKFTEFSIKVEFLGESQTKTCREAQTFCVFHQMSDEQGENIWKALAL